MSHENSPRPSSNAPSDESPNPKSRNGGLTRRQVLGGLTAGMASAVAGGKLALHEVADKRTREAEEFAQRLAKGENLEGLSWGEIVEAVYGAVKAWWDNAVQRAGGVGGHWKEPLSREDVERLLKEGFSVMVRVEGKMGDVVERGGEEIGETIAETTSANVLGLKTFGPAELNARVALTLALEHTNLTRLLEEKGVYQQGTMEFLQQKGTQADAGEIARRLRLFDVGSVVWGAVYFTRLASLYSRNREGVAQLNNARSFSLAWAAYSGSPATPAVSALQNLLNELEGLLGVRQQFFVVDGGWGPQTGKALEDLITHLEKVRKGEEAPDGAEDNPRAQEAREMLRKSAIPLLRSLRECKDILEGRGRHNPARLVRLARQALEVQHQSSLVREALWKALWETEEKNTIEKTRVAAHLIVQRYSTLMESYERLQKLIDEPQKVRELLESSPNSTQREALAPLAQDKRNKARNTIRDWFMAYLKGSDQEGWRRLLENPHHFEEKMVEHIGGSAAYWQAVWHAWWLVLKERVPLRWQSDGLFPGAIPTLRQGGLSVVDVSIPYRLALAWDLRESRHAIGIGDDDN
ncbi:MAG: hypothetical protein KatS3mg099_364 [Candidatus Parcubacteria bacterium]|nr:MAG: hypothetical protein KatS3mg099_364 [Candidatus Parcubacteria bacterium]